MDKFVFYFVENSLSKAFSFDESRGLTPCNLEALDASEPKLALVVFFSKHLRVVELEMPPKLPEKELQSLINGYAQDVLAAAQDSFAFSLPAVQEAQACGVGFIPKTLLDEIKHFLEEFNLIPFRIVPLEALLEFDQEAEEEFALLIKTEEEPLARIYRQRSLKEAFNLKIQNEIEVLNYLKEKYNPLITVRNITDLEEHFLKFSVKLFAQESCSNFSLDFAESPKDISKLFRFFSKTLSFSAKSFAILIGTMIVVTCFSFVFNLWDLSIKKSRLAQYLGVSADSEFEEEIKKLSSRVQTLQNDIQQLSVLRYPSILEVLNHLSKVLAKANLTIEGFDYAPPKLTLTGTSSDYASAENLKKELKLDRELFCAMEKEDIKDLRLQKKFSFEITLCKD